MLHKNLYYSVLLSSKTSLSLVWKQLIHLISPPPPIPLFNHLGAGGGGTIPVQAKLSHRLITDTKAVFLVSILTK